MSPELWFLILFACLFLLALAGGIGWWVWRSRTRHARNSGAFAERLRNEQQVPKERPDDPHARLDAIAVEEEEEARARRYEEIAAAKAEAVARAAAEQEAKELAAERQAIQNTFARWEAEEERPPPKSAKPNEAYRKRLRQTLRRKGRL